MTAQACKPLCKLTSVKAAQTWNKTYQDLYETAEAKIKRCMKFYDSPRALYLETDVSRNGLKARLLQIKDDMSCGCNEISDNIIMWPTEFKGKTLSGAEWHYSNIECKNIENSTWAREIPPLPLYESSMHHHRSQASGGYTEQRCGIAIKAVIMHPHINTPVECTSHITLTQIYTLQTCYPATTTNKTRTRKLKEWRCMWMPSVFQ